MGLLNREKTYSVSFKMICMMVAGLLALALSPALLMCLSQQPLALQAQAAESAEEQDGASTQDGLFAQDDSAASESPEQALAEDTGSERESASDEGSASVSPEASLESSEKLELSEKGAKAPEKGKIKIAVKVSDIVVPYGCNPASYVNSNPDAYFAFKDDKGNTLSLNDVSEQLGMRLDSVSDVFDGKKCLTWTPKAGYREEDSYPRNPDAAEASAKMFDLSKCDFSYGTLRNSLASDFELEASSLAGVTWTAAIENSGSAYASCPLSFRYAVGESPEKPALQSTNGVYYLGSDANISVPLAASTRDYLISTDPFALISGEAQTECSVPLVSLAAGGKESCTIYYRAKTSGSTQVFSTSAAFARAAAPRIDVHGEAGASARLVEYGGEKVLVVSASEAANFAFVIENAAGEGLDAEAHPSSIFYTAATGGRQTHRNSLRLAFPSGTLLDLGGRVSLVDAFGVSTPEASLGELVRDAYGLNAVPTKVFVDADTPRLNLAWDEAGMGEGAVFKMGATAYLAIADSSLFLLDGNTKVASVHLSSDASDRVLRLSDFTYDGASGFWHASFPCLDEGLYTKFQAQIADASAKSSELFSIPSFTVDRTPPSFGEVQFAHQDTAKSYGDTLVIPAGAMAADFATVPVFDFLSGVDPDPAAGHARAFGVVEQGGDWSFDGAQLHLSYPTGETPFGIGLVSVEAEDLAGNQAKSGLESLLGDKSAIRKVLLDSGAPVIDASWENIDARNTSYYAASRRVLVSVQEDTFALMRDYLPDTLVATLSLDGQATNLTVRDFEQAENGLWCASLPCDAEGDYLLTAGFTDAAGFTAEPVSEEFTVDKTPPSMEVSWDNNDANEGIFYKASRKATIKVHERNFSPDLVSIDASDSGGQPQISSWSSEGDLHTATVAFESEGTCSLTVKGFDLASNQVSSYDSGEFIIDKSAPQVDLGGLGDKTAYTDVVAPIIQFEDDYLSPLSSVVLLEANSKEVVNMPATRSITATQFSCAFDDFAHNPSSDGVYELKVTAADRAGNQTVKSVIFSVNRFGSTYYFSEGTGKLLGSYLDHAPEIVVHEVNPSGLMDQSVSLRLTSNGEARTLNLGTDYRIAPETGAKWFSYSYVVPASNFPKDAYYRLQLSSYDKAGHLNQNIMPTRGFDHEHAAEVSFAVDTTSPAVNALGCEEGKAVYAPNLVVNAYATDNMMIDDVVARVDGSEVAVESSMDTGASRVLSVQVESSDTPQKIEFKVFDKAGNKHSVVVDDVLVTDSMLVFWLHTPALFFGSLVLILLLIAAVTAAVVRVGKRKAA